MDKQKTYTVTQAVKDTMKEMPVNAKWIGYEIHNKVIRKLINNGSDRRPLDSTTLRLVRMYGSLFNVKAESKGKNHSVYIKSGNN